jgi:hypothetical protein
MDGPYLMFNELLGMCDTLRSKNQTYPTPRKVFKITIAFAVKHTHL